ncbi:hypothetical protein Tco_1476234 [Tanacetum coccineum]
MPAAWFLRVNAKYYSIWNVYLSLMVVLMSTDPIEHQTLSYVSYDVRSPLDTKGGDMSNPYSKDNCQPIPSTYLTLNSTEGSGRGEGGDLGVGGGMGRDAVWQIGRGRGGGLRARGGRAVRGGGWGVVEKCCWGAGRFGGYWGGVARVCFLHGCAELRGQMWLGQLVRLGGHGGESAVRL